MPKSSETNHRDEQELYEATVFNVKNLLSAHMIVLDDVCTTGAHARAAARRLTEQDSDSLSAMSVARTTQDINDELFWDEN